MSEQERLWSSVDSYFVEKFVAPDAALTACLEASAAAGLPAISVSPVQGKLLMMAAQMVQARRVLEIGTLGGYSTIWLAHGVMAGKKGWGREGRVVTLETNPTYAEVARANIERAGLSEIVDVRLGPALETLPLLAEESGVGPFDLVFIDADKVNTPGYLEWALKLSREGTMIVIDNVVRDGAIIDAASEDASVRGMRKALEMFANEPRIVATAMQTVGSKGYDGFAVGLVVE
ncbi:MAG: O-methyltransferase [Phycisphaerales bacterium]